MNGENPSNPTCVPVPARPYSLSTSNTMNLFFASIVFFLCIFSFPANSAEPKPATSSAASSRQQPYDSVEERRIMEAIKASGSGQSISEQEEIERRKKELKRLEGEVDKKIEQLNALRIKIEKLLKQKDAEEQKRVIELAKIYEKMPADKGATVIGNLELDLAISILRQMKTKSAAKILANMDREKAAKITTAFSTLDSR